MSSIFDTIAEYTNDITVDYREESYPAQKTGGFKLLPEGNYRVKIAAADVSNRTSRDGTPVLIEGWPKLVVEKLTIVAPEHVEGRKVITYADVFTNPRTKDGATVSELIDWIRAYDASATGLTTKYGQFQALQRFLEDEAELTIRIAWEGQDRVFLDDIKRTGAKPTKDEYKKATLRGKDFDEFGQGVGPVSGAPVKAQYRIAQFYSSLTAKDVKLARP